LFALVTAAIAGFTILIGDVRRLIAKLDAKANGIKELTEDARRLRVEF
jgi:hypothetical protein